MPRRQAPFALEALTIFLRVLVVSAIGLATLPAFLPGWRAEVITSGSMRPALNPGDVVVVRPTSPSSVRPGTIISFADARRGAVVTHRVVSVGRDGTAVTRGDANATRDPQGVDRRTVLGTAAVRVPFVGLPWVWVEQGRWFSLVATALVVLAVLGLPLPGRPPLASLRRWVDPHRAAPTS
ncbi:MAG: signal peptidase I [Acidimicrobiales bacterium]